MINISDNFILEQVKMLDFRERNFIKMVRHSLQLHPKNDNRYLISFSQYNEEKINDLISFINKKYNENIIIQKHILIILKLCNNTNENINIKKMYDKTDKNNTIIIDASKIQFDEESTIKYCYNMTNYENCINNNDNEKSVFFINEAKKILESWLTQVKNNEITYYDKDNTDGVTYKNYTEVLYKLFDLNKKLYEEYPEQLDVPIELYNKFNLENYNECEFQENEDVDKYIKKLKVVVDNYIKAQIQKYGKLNGVDFIKYLNKPPYGFITSKLTVYILMKVLKTYINEKYYYFDDDIYEKLDEMYLESFIINSINKFSKCMPSLTIPYICLLDEKIIRFINISKKIFSVDDEVESIVSLKEKLKRRIEDLKYPFWVIKYLDVKVNIKIIVNNYCDFLNPKLNEDNIYEINDNYIVDSILAILDNNLDVIDEIKELLKNEILEKGMKNLIGEKVIVFNNYIHNSLISNSWKWIWREEMVKEIAEY